MEKHEQDILEEIFGVEEIDDPIARREAVRERYEHLTRLQKLEVRMRLGRRVTEAAEKTPGSLYSPSTLALGTSVILLLLLCAVALYMILDTHIWVVLKVLVGLLSITWFFMAVRGLARIIYRTANHRDF